MATKWQTENRERWLQQQKDYNQRPDVRARRREWVRQKRLTDPEWAKRQNQAALAYHWAHHEEQLAKRRIYYRARAKEICTRQSTKEYRLKSAAQSRVRRATDPEKYREKARQWRQSNAELNRTLKARHYARKRGAAGIATVTQVKARFAYFGDRCIYCKKVNHLTIDHLIPLTRGGTNWPANLAPACRSCNSHKHNKTYLEFMSVLAKETCIG